MATRVTSIVLKDNQLGSKIKAVCTGERDVTIDGKKTPCRIFAASSAVHPDFDVIVPGFRNSVRFEGRKTVVLRDIELRVGVKRNNVGGQSRTLDLQVFAKELLVED